MDDEAADGDEEDEDSLSQQTGYHVTPPSQPPSRKQPRYPGDFSGPVGVATPSSEHSFARPWTPAEINGPSSCIITPASQHLSDDERFYTLDEGGEEGRGYGIVVAEDDEDDLFAHPTRLGELRATQISSEVSNFASSQRHLGQNDPPTSKAPYWDKLSQDKDVIKRMPTLARMTVEESDEEVEEDNLFV